MNLVIEFLKGFIFGFVITGLFLLLAYRAGAEESCQEQIRTEKTQITDHAPKALKDGKIIVVLSSGKTYEFSENDYKVVPRAKTEERVTRTLTCNPKEDKNQVLVGLRQGVTSITTEASGQTASTYSHKGPVIDAAYYRRKILGPVGAGAGVDLNGATQGKIRGFLGVDF